MSEFPPLPEGSHPKARWCRCPISGLPFLYPGFGRPSKVHPQVRKERAKYKRAERYYEKRKGIPPKKRGRPRKVQPAPLAA